MSGTTRKPSRCAASTSAAPGSAIAGQPASDSRPSERPSRSGCKRIDVCFADLLDAADRAPACRARRGTRARSSRSRPRSRAATARSFERGSGQRLARRAAERRRNGVEDQSGPAAARRARSISLSAISGRPMSEVGIVGLDARDERDAQALGLGARRAVVGLLAPQVALRCAARPACGRRRGRERRATAAPAACRVEQSNRGVEVDRACRSGCEAGAPRCRGCRACRSARRRIAATWSEPMISASGNARSHRLRLETPKAAAPYRPGLSPASARSSTPRRRRLRRPARAARGAPCGTSRSDASTSRRGCALIAPSHLF